MLQMAARNWNEPPADFHRSQMQKAIKSKKPLIGYNAVWGSNSDSPMTPIHFFAQQWNSTMVVGTASILNITCTSADKVTVSSLVSGAAKSTTRTAAK